MWEKLEPLKMFITQDTISLVSMCARAFIIYTASILFVRFNRKFMGIRTPYNFLLFVVIGSASATAITEGSNFIPILGTLFFLILVNMLLSVLGYFFPSFERFLIGSSIILLKNDKIMWKNMRRHYITKKNLQNALETQLHTDDFSIVRTAFLADDGTINFLVKK